MGPSKQGHIPKIKGEQRVLPFHTGLADEGKDATSAHSVALIAIENNRLATNALAEALHAVD